MAILERWTLLVSVILAAATALYYGVVLPRVKTGWVRRGLKVPRSLAVVSLGDPGCGSGTLSHCGGTQTQGWQGARSVSRPGVSRWTWVHSVSKLRAEFRAWLISEARSWSWMFGQRGVLLVLEAFRVL
jgi:hypothetical protein